MTYIAEALLKGGVKPQDQEIEPATESRTPLKASRRELRRNELGEQKKWSALFELCGYLSKRVENVGLNAVRSFEYKHVCAPKQR